MKAKIFDSHAHYFDEKFDADRDELLTALLSGPVSNIVNCGTTCADSVQCLEMAHRHPGLWAAVGIHPEEVESAVPGDLDRIRAMAADPNAVAIGEIGLDYHWDTPRDLQHFWFEEQIRLANELDMPVIVHDREAHGDTLEYLRKYRPKGVCHCFSGSVEMAKDLVSFGMYLGFNGVVTFPNARRPLEAAAAVPLDRILVETDCPYLAPVPFRGKRCDSSMIEHTAAVLAHVKGVTVAELLEKTAENAARLFDVPLQHTETE